MNIEDFLGDPNVKAVTAGNTAFALDLYQALREEEGNLFFSPFSISTALAMTYAGARANTAAEMATTLHFELPQEALHPAFAALQADLAAAQASGDIALHVANSLWPQAGYPFLPAYLQLCQQYYGVALTALDYAADPEAARGEINDWVADKTRQKITDLLKSEHVTALTTLILVNAIYFKGNWASQFDPDATEDAPFWLDGQRAVDTPLMAQTAVFGYLETQDIQVLELPYLGDRLAMVVLLPRQVDGLAALEDNLTVSNLQAWTRRLWPAKVQASLPRFKLTGTFNLSSTLNAMGMVDAFGAADFSGMTGGMDLFISVVVHKAFVEVNEEGSEAAAATAVVMGRSMPASPPLFKADHPFIFLIRDRATGSLLFLGRVANPAL